MAVEASEVTGKPSPCTENAVVLLSAHAFISAYEPDLLPLLFDPMSELLADTERAYVIAMELNCPSSDIIVYDFDPTGTVFRTFPKLVWELVYPC